MDIKLIPATEKDRAFFRHAHHSAYRGVIESMFGWDEKYQDTAADKAFNDYRPFIIEYQSDPVGCIGFHEKTDHFWLSSVFILPEYQGKGIGSFLVKRFIDQANAKKMALRLQTLRKNKGAKRLYERLGFKVTSSNEIHWQMECAI